MFIEVIRNYLNRSPSGSKITMLNTEVKTRLEVVKDQIIYAYVEKGQTLRELARFHECSAGSIKNFLDFHKVPLRSRGRKRKNGAA